MLKMILPLFPLEKYRVFGNSMFPSFKSFDLVLVNRLSYLLRKPKIGDVVIIRNIKGNLIKRIEKADVEKFFVVGDNKEESTDSRYFGFIERRDIIGRVMLKI